MASSTEIRRALAALLAVLDVGDVSVAPGEIAYEPGVLRQRFAVRAITGLPGDEQAEATLDELMEPEGARSIKALLEADHTLGGLVADVTVTRCTGWQLFRIDDHDAIGATWTVSTLS